MQYEELTKAVEKLDYRNKFKLAQLLIQLARKEEEEQYPIKRTDSSNQFIAISEETIQYVSTRLFRLRPSRKTTLLNSIAAMYQFQGAIEEKDKERIVDELCKRNLLSIDAYNRVSYSNPATVI
jgi:hypothetical protein